MARVCVKSLRPCLGDNGQRVRPFSTRQALLDLVKAQEMPPALDPGPHLRLGIKPRNYWLDPQNQKDFIHALARKLALHEAPNMEDYYNLTTNHFKRHGGNSLLAMNGSSVTETLKAVFPEHSWDLSRFKLKPRNFWFGDENQREYLISVGKALNIKEGDWEGWYHVSYEDFLRHGGAGFMKRHRHSVSLAIKRVFPEHKWDITKFSKKPRHYWTKLGNQREFVISLGAKMGLAPGDFPAWYKVTVDDIYAHGGKYLLEKNSSSVSNLLQTVFPEHKWDLSLFAKKPQNFWSSTQNHRTFLDLVGPKFGVITGDLSGWYKVKRTDLKKHGLESILQHFDSLSDLLVKTYPEHNWDLWRFAQQRSSVRKREDVVQAVAEYLEKNLSITGVENWYRVSRKNLKDFGLEAFMRSHGGLVDFLKRAYPNFPWDPSQFTSLPARTSPFSVL